MTVDVATSWGTITFNGNKSGVTGCVLPALHQTPDQSFQIGRLTCRNGDGDCGDIEMIASFVEHLFAGQPATMPATVFPDGPAFYQRVWRHLLHIPLGTTESYGAVARRIGHPRAARAVGQACGANPLPLVIPCHRVIGAHGRLGGFGCGLAWKRLLLARETV